MKIYLLIFNQAVSLILEGERRSGDNCNEFPFWRRWINYMYSHMTWKSLSFQAFKADADDSIDIDSIGMSCKIGKQI